jgi:hypothetical protein
MKFQVGDLLFIKDCKFVKHSVFARSYILEQLESKGEFKRLCLVYDSYGFFGIITKIINHKDAWFSPTSESDDVFILYSQLDGQESYFFADEVTVGESD